MENVTINGTKYKVSIIDTRDTIKNMIALKEQVPRNYINFTEFDINGKNIQIEILTNDIKSLSLGELVDEIDNLAEKWSIRKSDIAAEWLILKGMSELQDDDIDLLDDLEKINTTDFRTISSVNTTLQSYIERKNILLKEIAKEVEKEDKFRKEYAKYKPLKTTDFIQDSIIIEYKLRVDVDALGLFDKLSVNRTIPFARLNHNGQIFYKILDDLTPQSEWLTGDDTLIIKIAQSDKDDWGTGILKYTGKDTATITVDTAIEKDTGLDEAAIKVALLGLFGGDVEIVDRTEKGIKGNFAVPDINISREIFLDLITNERMVSHFLYVDETRELSSLKGVLYLYYSSSTESDDVLTVFLSERDVKHGDRYYQARQLPLFTEYLNVRVSRALNIEQINRFKASFAIILAIYKKKYPEIVKEYSKIIPGFKSKKPTITQKESDSKTLKALQAHDSDLFVQGYPTSCERKRQPLPISEDDIEEWEDSGYQIMNYPKGSDSYYVCSEDKVFKYPGIMENKLSNSESHPYLPCCYKINQQSGRKLLNLYNQGKDKTKKTKTSNIVAKKAVVSGKYGFLPKNIYHVLDKDRRDDEIFYRTGVSMGNNSFLEAVLLSLDPEYEKIDARLREDYVKDFRNNLASVDQSAVIQQLYDSDSKKITGMILDQTIPFDSKLFAGLLESYYSCQIVVFERAEGSENADFEIRRYTQGNLYRRLDPRVKTVLIYKHLGIRSDSLSTPHYELIVKRYLKIKGQTTWHFVNHKMISTIYSYFLKSYKLFITGKGRYAATDVPPGAVGDTDGQIIDKYGKCRGYTFENFYVLTAPVTPSYDLSIVEQPEELPTATTVLEEMNNRRLDILEQDVIDGLVIGFKIDLPGIPYAYIPCEPQSPLSGYPVGNYLGYSVDMGDNILQTTLCNKKIADFLMQLCLYSFSVWYAKQDNLVFEDDIGLAEQELALKNRLRELAREFMDSEVVVIEDHDYSISNLPRELTLNNSFFSGGKLVADSDETLRKLTYYLLYSIDSKESIVIGYKDRGYLDNYYTYTSDFKGRDGELIFIGDLSLENWMKAEMSGISNEVLTIPDPTVTEPFFFANWSINGNKPVLIQNVIGGKKERALAVSAYFIRDGINKGYLTGGIKELDHTIYEMIGGVMYKTGNGLVKIYKYSDEMYAAILVV